jgi:hypothetical protein
MERTFQYSFSPASSDPVGSDRVQLSIQEIEDAALLEVLQTPGAGLASWSFLDQLLVSSGPNTPFVFREPLGQAREVKVALSGLFGRFVARAYLLRYFGLSIFNHLSAAGLLIDARRRIAVKRRSRGDLPDWLACSADRKNLTIAEAKGCHDRPGPAKALDRAWTQTHRVEVMRKGNRVAVKRLAIATRWGSATGGPSSPVMAVRDPDESGVDLSPDDERALFVGLARKHFGTLLIGLGHRELGESLLRLTSSRLAEKSLTATALNALANSPVSSFSKDANSENLDQLIGGVATRQGLVTNRRASPSDERALLRLQLQPRFVGVDRQSIVETILGRTPELAISGEGELRRGRARGDRSGAWIIPLSPGEDQAEA